MSLVSVAVRHARNGDPIFRLRRGTKDKPQRDWANGGAIVDPVEAFDAFADARNNIGVRTDRLVVVDVDAHRAGFDTIKSYPPLPATYTVRTPNGGVHMYFRAPAGSELAGGTDKLGQGVDIKTGPRSYVLAAGSSFNDREYSLECDAPVAECPSWLSERLAATHRKSTEPPKTLGELDTSASIEAAAAYLRDAAPPAIEGSGGNETTYKVACQVKDRGVSETTCFDLMWEHYNSRCSPEWSPDELETVVGNAYRYGQVAAGRDNPAFGFCVVELPKPETPSRPTLFGASARRWVGKKPAPTPFVIDWLVPQGLVTLLVSAGGRGKSTLAQQMISCVASGRPFLGFEVKRGAAAGIFCEDSDNILHTRQLSICSTLKVPLEDIAGDIDPASYIGADTVMWTERGKTAFLDEIEAQVRARPGAKLLVIDGVSYVFAANEIDRGQVTRFIAALTALAQRLGIAIVLIHYESKSSADSDTHAASGSTAWINATRSVIKLNDDGGDIRTLKHIKTNMPRRKAPPLPCTLASGAFALIHDNAERREEIRSLASELIGEALSQGVRLSDKPQARDQWAPRYLAGQPRGQGVAEAEFEAAIKNLGDEFIFITEIVRSKPTRRCVRADAATLPPDP
jgi:hypothetical protein